MKYKYGAAQNHLKTYRVLIYRNLHTLVTKHKHRTRGFCEEMKRKKQIRHLFQRQLFTNHFSYNLRQVLIQANDTIPTCFDDCEWT